MELRRSMDPLVERAVRGKKLALLGEMLKNYNYPDPGVLSELTEGVSLVGEVAETGMLPFKFTLALLTIDALKQQSAFRSQQIMRDCKGSGDSEVDAEVEERDRGWLVGPIEESEVPDTAPIPKRFGLGQRHKVRLVDDYSESSDILCQPGGDGIWVPSFAYSGRSMRGHCSLV